VNGIPPCGTPESGLRWFDIRHNLSLSELRAG
jgi:hypothetical protein